MTKIQKILTGIVIGLVAACTVMVYQTLHKPNNFGAISIPESPYLFITTLQGNIASGDTSMTLNSGTLKNGNNLTGYQCFTLDAGTATAEYTCGTASGTAISNLLRGLDPQNPAATSTLLAFAHRRGADVRITDFPILQIVKRLVNGQDAFPNALSYDSGVSTTTLQTNGLNLASVNYVNGVALAGAPNATTTLQGLVQFATGSQLSNGTLQGSTGAYLVPGNSYFNSTPGSSTTVPVTLANGKLSQGFLDLTQNFTFTGNLTASNGTTTLAATSTKPLILDGVTYSFPFTQGSATTTLVNNGSGTLVWGSVGICRSGVTTHNTAGAGAQTIAHGLGVIPKIIRITAMLNNSFITMYKSWGVYTGATTATIYDATVTSGATFNSYSQSTDGVNVINLTNTTATSTVDSTNINLGWTNTTSGTANISWEACAY